MIYGYSHTGCLVVNISEYRFCFYGRNRKITVAHPVRRAIYFTNNNNHVNYSSKCSRIVGAHSILMPARYGAGRKVNHYYSTWWRHMIDDNNNINTYLTNNVFFFFFFPPYFAYPPVGPPDERWTSQVYSAAFHYNVMHCLWLTDHRTTLISMIYDRARSDRIEKEILMLGVFSRTSYPDMSKGIVWKCLFFSYICILHLNKSICELCSETL